MNKKQKALWRRLYTAAIEINTFKPWDHIPEHVPIFVTSDEKDSEKIVFEIIRQENGIPGIICFKNQLNFIFFEMRNKLPNPKDMPIELMQNALTVLWSDEDITTEKERRIINELGLKFKDGESCPAFSSIYERMMPAYLNDEEADFFGVALDCFSDICKTAEENNWQIDFAKRETLTCICKSKGTYDIAVYKYDEPSSVPTPQITDFNILKELRSMPRSDISIELDERCGDAEPEPFEEIVYYPLYITAVDEKNGDILCHNEYSYDYNRINALLDSIIELCGKFGRPKSIKVDDPFTYATLKDLCTQIGIKLVLQNEPLRLAGAAAIDMIEEEDEELDRLFNEMFSVYNARHQAPSIVEDDGMPKTFIISVSLYKGCYRHIKISGDSTLEDLHSAIIDAFDFDNDHAHVFFMDNRFWSDAGIYSSHVEDEEYFSCDYTLSQLLKEKQKFAYLFDFGDEWRFNCRVLHKYDEPCEETEVIRAVGEAPEQYPYYD